MLPKHMPTLEGKEAEKFVKQDKKPLNREQFEQYFIDFLSSLLHLWR